MKPQTPGHRVLIKPDTLEFVDPAFKRAKDIGIELLAKTERDEATIIDTGIVVQLGGTAFDAFGGREHWCKEGDKVSYTRYGGKMIPNPDNKDEKWLVLNDEDILMVWNKDD